MTGIYYLPELHNFEYLAEVPWPRIFSQQADWINTVIELEDWLVRYCGPHYSEWAYGQQKNNDYWLACVAFKRERNKTLFLLQWG